MQDKRRSISRGGCWRVGFLLRGFVWILVGWVSFFVPVLQSRRNERNEAQLSFCLSIHPWLLNYASKGYPVDDRFARSTDHLSWACLFQPFFRDLVSCVVFHLASIQATATYKGYILFDSVSFIDDQHVVWLHHGVIVFDYPFGSSVGCMSAWTLLTSWNCNLHRIFAHLCKRKATAIDLCFRMLRLGV